MDADADRVERRRPDLGEGPPHVTAGMYAELTVTA